MWAAKAIASVFGIGYLRGGGTLAAAVLLFCWWWLAWWSLAPLVQLLLIVVVALAGTMAAQKLEPEWGHDSSRVVIDEVLGMMVSLFMLPPSWWIVGAAFVLFRLLDIVKPLYLRRAENIRGGAGVMLDDLLAGVYTSVTLHLVLLTTA